MIARTRSGGRVPGLFHSAPGLLWLLCGGALFFGLPLLIHIRGARRRKSATSSEPREVATVALELARLESGQEGSQLWADETPARVSSSGMTLTPSRSAPPSTVSPAAASVAAPVNARSAARPASSDARWDAPPPAASLNAAGWAGWTAPPAPARSGRFHRTGHPVAASLADGGRGAEPSQTTMRSAMRQKESPPWSLRAKWHDRRGRKAERELERIANQPCSKDPPTRDQAEHAVVTIPTSSGGMIG
jgi:hypothetical protein